MNLIRGEEGQALVEFALISSLFILLFVGIADYSIYIHMQLELNDAAASGAACGAYTDTQANTSAMQTVAAYSASDISNLSTVATYFYSCTQGGASVTSTTVCNGTFDSHPYMYVKVVTSAPVPAALRWSGIPSSLNLTGQASYRVRWVQ